ncbi:MAG: hypothetical protein NW214_03875 [Pseudanabaenaceae cyanobacterium bins.39]|nr:hypothetical protein [Pseudanabaenaceae cyanobacterium bins.39]
MNISTNHFMQKAYLIISESQKRLVDADTVKHSDYGKIFQCPRCGGTLTLREGHYRSGNRIRATFVHSEGDHIDCDLRVNFETSSPSQPVFDLIEKGQRALVIELVV